MRFTKCIFVVQNAAIKSSFFGFVSYVKAKFAGTRPRVKFSERQKFQNFYQENYETTYFSICNQSGSSALPVSTDRFDMN